MPLKLTVPNSFFHFLIAFAVTAFVVGAFAYVVLPGTVPNPGHALSTIQGYFQTDASLVDSLAKLQQRVSGTCAAGSSIRVVNADGTVSCEIDDVGAGTSFANPSASIGLGVVNGSATTAMRSDAAPVLSQAIVPTWTGTHSFSNATYSALFTGGNVGIGTATPGTKLDVSGTARMTGFQLGASTTSGYVLTANSSGVGTWQAAAAGGTGDITGVTAGTGLTGGGMSGDVTLNVGAGNGISVAADSVALAYPTKSCAAGEAIQSFNLGVTTAPTCVTIPTSAGICTYNGRTYSEGTECCQGFHPCGCWDDGSWHCMADNCSCGSGSGCPAPPASGYC